MARRGPVIEATDVAAQPRAHPADTSRLRHSDRASTAPGGPRGWRRPTIRSIGIGVGGLVVLLAAAALAVGSGGPNGPVGSHGGPVSGVTAGGVQGPGQVGAGVGGGALVAGGSGAAAAGPGAATSGPVGGGATGGSSGAIGAPASGPTSTPATPLVQTKVIKTGQIGLQVRAALVARTMNGLTLLASTEGGFVASSSSSQSDSVPSGSITLRVPAGSFEDAVAKVRGMGKVVSATASGQDVTAQYVDLQAQITALQQAQTRFLTILAKASSIGDILAVQQQVDSVDSQLQQLEGQQRVLEDQTTYGTLSVNVDVPAPPPPAPKPAPGPWKTAVLRAGNGFADGIQGLISVSGSLAFAALCVLAVLLLGWLGWRRLRPAVQT